MLETILGQSFDKRVNQEDKYTGFLGKIELPDGTVMTEKSISVDIDGKKTLIPAIVPTNKKFLKQIAQNNMNKQIIDNAVNHAMKRINKGLSPFYQEGENDPLYIKGRYNGGGLLSRLKRKSA